MSNISQQPPNTTILTTNAPQQGQTWIYLPQSGTLWVAYEYAGTPGAQAFLWHQGGKVEYLVSGSRTYTVNASDALVCDLGEVPSATIKLGWAYV